MKKNTKKITAIATVASASVLFLMIGARAVFTDDGGDFTMILGEDGTVDISVTDLDYDVDPNGKEVNINPGDCDPYSPAIVDNTYRDGTEHPIVYHVENLGTKSVRTRHVITLEMFDKNSEVVDPSFLMISELEGQFLKEINNEYNSLSHKYYCMEDGTRIEVTEKEAFFVDETGKRLNRIGDCGLEPSPENIKKLNLTCRIVKVQYVIISEVLDGTSADMDHSDPYFQDPAEIEHETQTTGSDYTFYLGLYHRASTNAYSETSIIAEDNKIYLLEGLNFDDNNKLVSGTEVTRVLNGHYNEALEVAPDGKMYAADDTTVSGTTIKGSVVEYIDMKYKNASLVAPDGHMYLVKGFSFGNEFTIHADGTQIIANDKTYTVEDTKGELNNDDFYYNKKYSNKSGNTTESYIFYNNGRVKHITETRPSDFPAGATVSSDGLTITINGKSYKTTKENINGSTKKHAKGYYPGVEYIYKNGEDTEVYIFFTNDSRLTITDVMENGTATYKPNVITLNKDILIGTRVVKQGNTYYNATTNTEVSIDEVKHWDVSGVEVWNSNPRYYKYTNAAQTEYVEINKRDVVHWKKNASGKATYTMVYHGDDKYVLALNSNTEVQPNEIAHWDNYFNLVMPTDIIGEQQGQSHETLGFEGASVKVSIEIQAQQYRNTTNDDWKDWTTYSSTSKEYTITDHYAPDFDIN